MFVVLKMKRIEFCNFDEFVDNITNLLAEIDDVYPIITVHANYDVIKEIFEKIIKIDIPIYGSVELEDYEANYYGKEFILYLTKDGVSVGKAWNDDNKYSEADYYISESDIAFVHEDCNSKMLKNVRSDVINEFCIYDCCDDEDTELDNNDGSSESVYVSKSKEGKPLGFSKSWNEFQNDMESYASYSFYSSDEDVLRDMAARFGIEL